MKLLLHWHFNNEYVPHIYSPIFLCVVKTIIFSGGLVSHQSPLFQEEFPSLAAQEEAKNKEATTQPTKKEEDIKDTQYGPGPSLRPQSKFLQSHLSHL